ncbi:heavy metal translocating P-type ATPase, partial [Mycobacterium sp. ITM-2017-0098]
DGVAAAVNYATEKASVTVPDGYDPAQLIAEVENAGYSAALPTPEMPAPPGESGETDDADMVSLRHRLTGSVLLSVPVIAMAMIP